MPDDFWPLTLREFVLQQRGYQWRHEQEQWRMANIVAALSNPVSVVQVDGRKVARRKRVTAADVLGKGKREPHKSADPQEHKRIFDALVRKTKHWKPRERRPNPS